MDMTSIVGKVHLQLIDKDGTILKEINDTNDHTLWAARNSPVGGTLLFDFVTVPVSQSLGVDTDKVKKTFSYQLATIRSNMLSSSFTLTGNTYSINFNWTNSTSSSVNIVGLISYYGSNIYTHFNLESNPFVVSPGSIIIGRYEITYSRTSPAFVSDSSTTGSITNSNSYIYETLVSPEIRKYKYSRAFFKTSQYQGVSLTDTGVTCSGSVSITSSHPEQKAFNDSRGFNNLSAEVYYKFLSDGLPGAARARREIIVQSTYTVGKGATYYEMSNFTRKGVLSTADYPITTTDSIQFVNTENNEIKPIKYYFPQTVTAPAYVNVYSGWKKSYNPYLSQIIPRFVPGGWEEQAGAERQSISYIAYLYWNDSPTFSFYYNTRDTINVDYKLYINGVAFSVTSYTAVSSQQVCANFTLTSLTAGSGIVVITYNTDLSTSDGGQACSYVRDWWWQIKSNMWGYLIPCGSILSKPQDESNVITGGWISPTFCNYNGVNMIPTQSGNSGKRYLASDIPKIGLVTNAKIYDCTITNNMNIWVTEENFNKVAGAVYPSQKLTVFGYKGSNGNPDALSQTTAVSIGKNNFTFLSRHYSYMYNVARTSIMHPAIYELYMNSVPNPYYSIDLSNRVWNNTTDLFHHFDGTCTPPSTTKVAVAYLAREQGTQKWDKIIDPRTCSYTEGQATVTINGTIYEIEATVQTSEQLCDHLTVNWNPSSVLVTNQYLSFPLHDCNHTIAVDYLETWQYAYMGITKSDLMYDADPLTYRSIYLPVGVDEIIQNVGWTNDTNKYLVRHKEKENVNVWIPSTNVGISDKEFTHYQLISFLKSDTLPTYVTIPKSFVENTITKFVNVERIHVTDGLHTIPWSLDTLGVSTSSQIGSPTLKNSWTIRLNKDVVSQIYPKNRTTQGILYVYIVAKPKSEILPLEVPIINNRCQYVPPEVKFLVQSNHTQGSTVFTDTSTNNITITQNSVIHSTAKKIFSKSSLYFNGSSYLSTAHHADMVLGTSDFTVHWWEYRTSTASGSGILTSTGTATLINGAIFGWYESGNLKLYLSSGTGSWDIASSVNIGTGTQNTWKHYAVTRSGDTFRTFENGVQISTFTSSASIYNQGTGWRVGGRLFIYGTDGLYTGYLQELVFIKGKALWTSSFTVPTKPISSVLYPSKESITRITLPYALDRKINVKDKNTSSDISFTALKYQNLPVTSDTDRIQSIYVKLPDLKYGTIIQHGYYPLKLTSVSGSVFNIYGSAPIICEDTREAYDNISNLTFSCQGYTGYVFITDKDFLKAISCTLYSSINIAAASVAKTLIIESSETVKLSNPDTFFDLYVQPSTVISKATSTWNLSSTTTASYADNYFTYSNDNSGVAYALSSDPKKIEVYGYTSTNNYIMPYATIIAGDLSTSSGASVASGNTITTQTNSAYSRQWNFASWNAGCTSQYKEPSSHWPEGNNKLLDNNLLFYDANTISSVTSYYEDPYIWHKYKYLSLISEPFSVRNGQDNTKDDANSAWKISELTQLATPVKYLYTTSKALNVHNVAGYGAYTIDNNTIKNFGNFKIKSYFTKTFSSLNAYRSTRRSQCILTDTTSDYYATVIASKRPAKLGESTNSYAFTDNVDLANVFNTYAPASFKETGNCGNCAFTEFAPPYSWHYYTHSGQTYSLDPSKSYFYKIDIAVDTIIDAASGIGIYDTTGTIFTVSPFNEAYGHVYYFLLDLQNRYLYGYRDGSLIATTSLSAANLTGYCKLYVYLKGVTNSTSYLYQCSSRYKSSAYASTIPVRYADNILLTSSYTAGFLDESLKNNDKIASGTPMSIANTSLICFKTGDISTPLYTAPSNIPLDLYLPSNNSVLNEITGAKGQWYNNSLVSCRPNPITLTRGDDVQDTSTSLLGICQVISPQFQDTSFNAFSVQKNDNTALTSGLIFDKKAVPMMSPEYTSTNFDTTTLDKDAYYVDTEVCYGPNMTFNIIFDTTQIPVNKIDRLGNFSIYDTSTEAGNSLVQIFPLIKIIDTSNSTSNIFAIRQIYFDVVDVTTKLTTLTDNNFRIQFCNHYQYDTTTYDNFNSLLSTYSASKYVLQYGFVAGSHFSLYKISKAIAYGIQSLSIQPVFNDESLYKSIDWCWVNTVSEKLDINKNNLQSDVTNYEVKIFNPNAITATSQVIRIDLTAYDLAGFNTGCVIQKDNGNDTWIDQPTVFEMNASGDVSPDFLNSQKKYAWIKTTILGDTVHRYKITNKTNTYLTSDVFNFYENFESIQGSIWTRSWTPPTFTATGADTTITPPGEATSQRIMYIDCRQPVRLHTYSDSLELAGTTQTSYIESLSSFTTAEAIEICYKIRYKDVMKIRLNNIIIFPNVTLPDTKSDVCWVNLLIDPTSGAVTYRIKPLESGHWWIEQHESVDTSLTTSSGLLRFTFEGADDSGYCYISWIRTRNKDLGLIQLRPEDVKLLVKSEPTDWYLFDLTDTSTPNKDALTESITECAKGKRCGFSPKKWKRFPDTTELNMTHYGSGNRLNYS